MPESKEDPIWRWYEDKREQKHKAYQDLLDAYERNAPAEEIRRLQERLDYISDVGD